MAGAEAPERRQLSKSMDPWLEKFANACFERGGDTAHDLKTPLNVAILNLELLRMRIRKVGGGVDEDEKFQNYAGAIDLELRRMSKIFDSYFLFSCPPRDEGPPVALDVVSLAATAAAKASIPFSGSGGALILAHETRLKQALNLCFEGAAKLFDPPRHAEVHYTSTDSFRIVLQGTLISPHPDLLRIFKFYYTDSSGQPDLALAGARLIVETYGGELNIIEESDKVELRLSFPLGEK